jgi:hypothetical protein
MRLAETQIHDNGLALLAGLEHLKYLDLTGTHFSDQRLTTLKAHSRFSGVASPKG